MQEEGYVAIQIIYMESWIILNIYEIVFFLEISRRFKHNQNKSNQHWRKDSGWHVLSIVTHATAWRWEM